MGYGRKQDITYKLLRILQEHTELILGKGRDPLEYPQDRAAPWVSSYWVIGLDKFLQHNGGSIRLEYDCVLKPQRERDKFMMKLEMGTKGELCSIQQFCLCLKAETVVDVFSADGTALNESVKLSEMNSEGK